MTESPGPVRIVTVALSLAEYTALEDVVMRHGVSAEQYARLALRAALMREGVPAWALEGVKFVVQAEEE